MKKQNPYVITDEMVDDILCTAFEGGINYWAVEQIPDSWPESDSKMFPGESPFASEILTMSCSITIVPDPEVDDKTYTLTLEKMKQGIRKEAKRQHLTPLDFYEQHDAGGADNAVQYALFGKIIYA